jgi:4,5-dihydroxyphthalate decarboxylase
MAANLKTIEALSATAFKQKLTPRAMQVEELFVDPEKA